MRHAARPLAAALALAVFSGGAAAQPRPAPPGANALPDPAAETAGPAAPRGGDSLTPVGAWRYGPTYAVDGAPDGSVLSGHGHVLRIAGPPGASTPPQEIVMPGLIRDIVLAGDLAYVATSHATDPAARGIFVVQLSPAGASVGASVTGRTCVALDVAADGRLYAVVFDPAVPGYRLVVLLRASLPVAPLRLGEVPIAGTAGGVDHLGTTVYVAAGNSGVAVVDAADGSTPVVVRSVAAGGFSRRVAVERGVAAPRLAVAAGSYVTNQGAATLFSLADPAAPVATAQRLHPSVIEDVAWSVDPSGPAQLFAAASTDGVLGLDADANAVAFAHDYLRNLVPGSNRLAAVPGARLLVGDYYYGVVAYDASLAGPEFLATGYSFAFSLAADAADPRVVYAAAGGYGIVRLRAEADGRLVETGRASDAAWNYTRSFAQTATFLYVADNYSGLHVVDKATMQRVATLPSPTGYTGTVAVSEDGQTLFAIEGLPGTVGRPLRAYSLADPSFPAEMWSRSDLDPYEVASAGGVAYVGADEATTVAVVRLDDPFGTVATLETAGPDVAVRLAGGRLYAYGGDTDVSVFDVSAPALPVLLGAVSPVNGAGIDVRRGALYVAGSAGVAVFDAQPAAGAAAPLATYAGQAGALVGIAATATDVFLAESASGVERLAADITVAAEAGAPGGAEGLSVAPNPTAGPAAITFALAATSDVQVEILDVLGRRVRVLASGPAAAGGQRVAWDGRGDAGHPVAAGVYVVRVSAGGTVRTQPVTVVR